MEKNRQSGIQTQKSLYKTIFEGDLYYDIRLGEDGFWIGNRETVFWERIDKSFIDWLWDALGEPTEESQSWIEGGETNGYWRWWKGVKITVERIIE